MLRAQQKFEQPLNDARSEARYALVKYEKASVLEKQGRGHAVHQFTAKDEAKVEVGDHYTINNYTNKPSNKVSKEQIMGWMKCTDFTTVYKQRHLPTLLPNVGEKPLKSDEFKHWYDGTKKWLWCHGMPGVGKSALATIIIRYILQLRKQMAPGRNMGLAYFYCDYANKEQSALDYVGALLCQLISLSDEVSPEVAALYNDHKPGSSPSRSLLEAYELALVTEVGRFDSVYIIVDALDECTDDDEGESQSCTKARVLETFGKLGEKVHLLFTSRDEHPPTSLTDPRVPMATMKVTTTDKDIRTYVRGQIKRRESLRNYTDSRLREKIEIVIMRKAAGMFLPAKLYMEILVSRVDVCKGTRTMADALKKTLQDLPQFNHAQVLESYQEAYQEILKNIWNQSHSRVKLARQVLSWVVFTLEPSNLTLPFLQQALSLQDADETVEWGLEPTDAWAHAPDSGGEDDSETYSISSLDDDSSGASTTTRGDVVPKETLLSVCRGLITMDKDTGLIRLVHYTAQDYFANENVRADSFPHAQSQLARSCMASLMSTDADHPFDQYSRRHWGHHAQTVEMEFQKEIIDLVQDHGRMMNSFQLIVNSLPYAWTESRELAIHCLPPLHAAAYFGLELTAKHLMQRLGSEDIKTRDSRGWTAMKWAVIGGSETLARLLFQRESDLLSSDIAFFAVSTQPDLFLAKGISFRCGNTGSSYFGDTLSLKNGLSFTKVLPRATRPNASDEVVRFLLKNTPDENIDSQRPGDGRTLLSIVAENWQWDYVGILLERGADVNLKDNRGQTPLLWALNRPRQKTQVLSIITLDEGFISIGGTYIDRNNNMTTFQPAGDVLDLDSTAGINIADHQISEETVEPFLCKLIGNNLEAINEEGKTALSLACESRFHVLTKELVGRGADLSTRDGLGMTPLHYACCLPCFKTVMIEMVMCSGKSKVRLGASRLPQMYPRKHDNISGSIGRSVELLLKSGAEVDAQNCLGETPLSLAEEDGLESYVRLLSPHVRGSFGQTGPSPGCVEGRDYAKLLLAMWHGGNRFQVKSLTLADDSTLTTHCLSYIECLSLVGRGSVVLSGKSKIGLGVTLDESRIEIRKTSLIGSLSVQGTSQAIIRGSPSICMVCGSGTSILDIQTESTMEGIRIFARCAMNCGGSSGIR